MTQNEFHKKCLKYIFDKIEDLINYILSIKNETLQEIPENIVYD